MFTVLKHFPGHGHADGDSHRGRVRTPPLAQLRADDLRPYAELLGPGGRLAGGGRSGVMVGHLDVPGLTDGLPSSLTPAVYALLRDDYGFDGVVFTDDLGAMKAVTGSFALPEAVEQALAAGRRRGPLVHRRPGDPGPGPPLRRPAHRPPRRRGQRPRRRPHPPRQIHLLLTVARRLCTRRARPALCAETRGCAR